MTIKREINGVMHEIQLTKNELYNAFCEQQHKFDEQDVLEFLEVFLEDNKEYTREQVMRRLPDIVWRYRKGIDWLDWWDCARCAFNDSMCEG